MGEIKNLIECIGGGVLLLRISRRGGIVALGMDGAGLETVRPWAGGWGRRLLSMFGFG